MKKVRDHYFNKAKKEGFSARSVFKLEEIDQKRKLLRPGMRVVDLGCAPGSWVEYTIKKVMPGGAVVGVDLQAVNGNFPPQVRIIQGDVFEIDPAELLEGGERFDVVLSDMAPNTTGIRSADAARSTELSRRALQLAQTILRPGGVLLVKVFQGAALPELRKEFSESFEKVTLEKPKASRSESVEVFLLGMGKLAASPLPE